MPERKHEAAAEEESKEAMSWWTLAREFQRTLQATAWAPMPGEFWQHVRAARKESLLAARSLLDAKIAHLEQQQQRSERKATKVVVQ